MLTQHDVEDIGQLLRTVAAAEILPRWRKLRPDEIEMKSGPDDLVTAADRGAESALAAELLRRYPGSVVVGEETFAADPDCIQHLGGDRPVWIIDPIDGTGAFTRGETTFGSMMALARGQELQAAWILQPVSGDLYLGARGGGVRRVTKEGDVTPLASSGRLEPHDMTGIVSVLAEFDGRRIARERIRPRFAGIEPLSCPAIDYPKLLTGKAQFTVFSMALPWDHLPGVMLASELGCAYAKLDGSPYLVGDREGGVMTAPTRAAWQAIRRSLAD